MTNLWKTRRALARLLDRLVIFLVPEATNLQYLQKLERRIHNQRVALRQNWEIVEMRQKEEAAPIYRSRRPIRNKWWEHVKKQNRVIKELRQRLGEI